MSNTNTIQTNEHVNYTIDPDYGFVEFTPENGYALWDDTEVGNLDENGNPICYWLIIGCPNVAYATRLAPHIWAKEIDDTMEVYGNGNHIEATTTNNATEQDYQEALAELGVELNG